MGLGPAGPCPPSRRAAFGRAGVTFATIAAAAVSGLLSALPASAATLPDGRVYEQVTPVDKGGALIASSSGYPVAASPDGGALLWDTLFTALPSSSATPTAANLESSYVFQRDSAGVWSYQAALAPDNLVLYRGGQTDSVLGVSSDLSTSIASTFFGLTDGHDGIAGTPVQTSFGATRIQNLASYNIGAGTGTVLTPPVPTSPNLQTTTYSPTFVGTSSTADHVVFAANASFPVSNGSVPNPGANPGPFLFDYTGGSLRQLGLETDDSTPFPGGASAPQVPGVVSGDGSRVFFEAAESGSPQLFMRENDGTANPQTVPVSISSHADPNCSLANNGGGAPTASATFEGATTTGTLAFFLSNCALTSSSHTGAADDTPDLYEYDTANQTVTDLSVDTSGGDAATGANVLGVVGYSADGSYVYFVADGLLDGSGAPSGEDGAPNLYLAHAGAVTYLATLSPADTTDWTPHSSITAGASQYSSAQVSPDGRYLLLASSAPLTSYDSNGDAELYEFTTGSVTPTCVSCDPATIAHPAGAPPTGPATMTLNSLADTGSVLFTSPDPLVPADVNTVNDVYEWEATAPPPGAGSPGSGYAADSDGGGTIALISGGAATISPASSLPSTSSTLIAASPSGADAFFVTYDQLAGQDQDDLPDIYDAAVDGTPAPGAPVSGPPPCVLALDGSCATGSMAPNLTPPPNDLTGTNVTTTIGETSTASPVAAVTATVGAITARQRSAFARTGKVALAVRASGATTISATAKARIGRRTVTVARATRALTRAGSATLSLTLSAAARRVLARHSTLRLAVTVSVSHGTSHTLTIALRR